MTRHIANALVVFQASLAVSLGCATAGLFVSLCNWLPGEISDALLWPAYQLRRTIGAGRGWSEHRMAHDLVGWEIEVASIAAVSALIAYLVVRRFARDRCAPWLLQLGKVSAVVSPWIATAPAVEALLRTGSTPPALALLVALVTGFVGLSLFSVRRWGLGGAAMATALAAGIVAWQSLLPIMYWPIAIVCAVSALFLAASWTVVASQATR